MIIPAIVAAIFVIPFIALTILALRAKPGSEDASGFHGGEK